MTTQQGRLTSLAVGTQADFDTPAVADAYTCLHYYTSAVVAQQPDVDDPLLGCGYTGRDDTVPLEGLITVAGPMDVPMELHELGIWLRGLLGPAAAPSANGGRDDHVFTSGAEALPFLTIEQQLKSNIFMQLNGILVNSLGINLSKEAGGRRISLGLLGKDEVKLAASQAGTIAASPFAQAAQMLSFSGKLELDDVEIPLLRSASFECSNNAEDKQELNGLATSGGFDLGTATARGSITAGFADATLYDIAAAHTEGKLELLWSKGNYALGIEMPVVRFARTGIPVQGPGRIDQNFDWRAAHDEGGSNPMMTVTLTNSDATGYA